MTRARKTVNIVAQLIPCLALLTLALTTAERTRTVERAAALNISHAVAAGAASGAAGAASGAAGAASGAAGAASGAAGDIASGVLAAPSPGPLLSTLLCGVSIALGAATQAGCWSNMLDVAPQHVSVLLGIANTFGTFPGILCNLARALRGPNTSCETLTRCPQGARRLVRRHCPARCAPLDRVVECAWREAARTVADRSIIGPL